MEIPSGHVGDRGVYWLLAHDPTFPGLIMISESDDVASTMRAIAEWDDVLDLTVVPAMTGP